MAWAYFPDGKLKAKSDDGVPVGSHSEVTDDDTNGLYTATGTWTKASAIGQQGTSHRTHAAAAGSTDKFTWTLDVPADGAYTLAAAWPQVSGAATDAKFTLNHGDGAGTDVNFTANQATGAGAWNTLGKVTLSKGEKVTVALAASGAGTVVADSVRLVRDNAADTDAEDKAFAYGYDLNGNLTDITDTSRGTAKNADAYAMAYDGLNQIKSVREDLAGSPAATTSYTYNNLGKPLTVAHPDQASDYVYNDPRNLLTKVTVDDLNDTKAAKVTSYTYDTLGRQKTVTKGNGNVTTNAFQSDGALKSMHEETSAGALVASHEYTYDANGNQLEDVASKKNADAEGTLDSTTTHTYDPVDRLKGKTKTGHNASTETYVHDANANVIQQTVGGTSTSFNYDRNRLLSSTADGQTASYRYDPFGRQTSVVGGGKTISRTTYDGFDHIKVAEQANDAGILEATTYTYDPLDRTASKTTSGTEGKTTDYTYLGLSQEVLGEEVAGELTKSYQYSPWGQRLSQVSHKADTEAGVDAGETGYYGYNAHTDVETITDDAGSAVATYGYTAYGENDDAEFTGIDKPDAENPEQPGDESFNAYRFNGKRWDAGSGTYDMGFRDYNPGLNTFTTRDMYNGALADMGLGIDPFTSNRYAFAAGNPISRIELDGHMALDSPSGGGAPSQFVVDSTEKGGYTGAHDAALVAAVPAAEAWAKEAGLEGVVTIDAGDYGKTANTVEVKENKSGKGYADMIFWGTGKDEGKIFVWEMKINTAETLNGVRSGRSGEEQLNGYVAGLNKMFSNMENLDVQKGPELGWSEDSGKRSANWRSKDSEGSVWGPNEDSWPKEALGSWKGLLRYANGEGGPATTISLDTRVRPDAYMTNEELAWQQMSGPGELPIRPLGGVGGISGLR